jgi:long-chain acyl-CoA synthetase
MNNNFSSFAELFTYLKILPPNPTFINHQEAGHWKHFSKKEFLENVQYLALAFEKKGWRGKHIGIALAPSAYWLMIDYALMLSGAVSVPLFTNISSKNLRYQIKDAGMRTIFIQTEGQEEIILEADPVITCIGIDTTAKDQPSLGSFIKKGQEIHANNPEKFADLHARITPDDLVTIVYTSGTSGLPKGVELSHKNLISQIIDTRIKYACNPATDSALSFLPLAHIFERMVMHFYISTGMSIFFADNVKNVGNIMREIHPTIMTVVPRLLEKVCFKMRKKAMSASFIKKNIARIAFYRSEQKDPFSPEIWLDSLLSKLVYGKFRAALGGNIRMLISGGAPLSDDLYRFFLNIGIPTYQGYGLTEASPVICANAPSENRIGTCGRHFVHTEVKTSPEGELLARGPGIMLGYHNNVEATNKTIDTDGWLATGDLATIDSDGYVTITGRKKDLSKTSTGEYISVNYIEQLLMATGWFDHVLVVGNARPFVSVLLMVDYIAVNSYAKNHGLKDTAEVVETRKFQKIIFRLIKKINRKLNHWEKVRKFYLISATLTIEDGDLTPSMKLARQRVESRFKDVIDNLYAGHI